MKQVYAIAIIAGLLGIAAWLSKPAKIPETGKVAEIEDAGTVVLGSGQRVRYLGVNIPAQEECFGDLAREANESLLGKRIRLEKDPLAEKAPDGAYLRYVYFTPEKEEIFINTRIIEGGFGFPLLHKEMIHHNEMAAAGRYASATGRGLWGECEVEEVSPGVFKTNPNQ